MILSGDKWMNSFGYKQILLLSEAWQWECVSPSDPLFCIKVEWVVWVVSVFLLQSYIINTHENGWIEFCHATTTSYHKNIFDFHELEFHFHMLYCTFTTWFPGLTSPLSHASETQSHFSLSFFHSQGLQDQILELSSCHVTCSIEWNGNIYFLTWVDMYALSVSA